MTEQTTEKEKKITKRPSALKRQIQSEKKRLSNRSYRSRTLTAIRSFEAALVQKEAPEVIKTKLSAVYSLMDKGIKQGVFKANKVSRTKSRLTARITAV